MQYSEKYELILNCLKSGIWSKRRVKAAIGRLITQEEAEEILSSKSE